MRRSEGRTTLMGGMMGCSMGGMWLFGGVSLVVLGGILGTGVMGDEPPFPTAVE
jgi:hypothetical protein